MLARGSIAAWLGVLLLGATAGQAQTVTGQVRLDPGGTGEVTGVAHILEDTADNRSALERLAQAVERSALKSRQLRVQTVSKLTRENLRQLSQLQARLQGQLDRLTTMARVRARVSAPIAAGTFRVDIPFSHLLLLVVAQNGKQVGWWLQDVDRDTPLDFTGDSALHLRSLIPVEPPSDRTSEE